jgi:hypothetical protein
VSPTSRDVAKDAGTTTFSVSNTGTGTMPWTAAVTSGGSWLSITSGDSGSNSGTINCSFNANTGTSTRTGTIRVTADGATGSPVDVTVTQAPTPTPLTITASAGTGGTISPSGEVSVAYGGDQTFTIAHDAGYIVSSFSIDGSPITFPASDVDYTFPNVTTNHTISVSFTEGVSPLGYFGKIYQDPLEVLPGATVLQSGKGFTRNSPVTLRVRDSIGQEHNFFYLTTDDNGDFTRLTPIPSDEPGGTYSWCVIDDNGSISRQSLSLQYNVVGVVYPQTGIYLVDNSTPPSVFLPETQKPFGILKPLGSFDKNKECFVIVHGWNGNIRDWVNAMGTDINQPNYHANGANVFLWDWEEQAKNKWPDGEENKDCFDWLAVPFDMTDASGIWLAMAMKENLPEDYSQNILLPQLTVGHHDFNWLLFL